MDPIGSLTLNFDPGVMLLEVKRELMLLKLKFNKKLINQKIEKLWGLLGSHNFLVSVEINPKHSMIKAKRT